MKTKLLFTLIAFVLSGTMVFAQVNNKTVKKETMKSPTEMQKDSVYYSCTMHPDVKMDKPGKCPKCGMDLVKMTTKTPVSTVNKSEAMKTYVCTMHPEVTSDKPGKCPKCGMDLVIKKL
jgi:hypothetical protein